MSIFSRYPYTDFHRLNADWILDKIKEAATSVTEALGLVRQSAADAAAAAQAAQQAAAGSVKYDRAQTLTTEQQSTARGNIGAASSTDVNAAVEGLQDIIELVSRVANNCVRYDGTQGLTTEQQSTARGNIGAASSTDVNAAVEGLQDIIELVSGVANNCVRYDGAQGLTQAQQAQARANIGAAAEGSTPAPAGAVLYDQAQTLTGAQQNQARGNIGAAAQTDPNLIHSIELVDDNAAGGEGDELTVTLTSVVDQSKVLLAGQQSDNVILSGLANPVNANDAANKSYVDGYKVTVSGTAPTITPVANTIYGCNELSSLTISNPPSSGKYSIIFFSGATATLVSGIDNFTVEANKRYRINVQDGYATFDSWPYTPET